MSSCSKCPRGQGPPLEIRSTLPSNVKNPNRNYYYCGAWTDGSVHGFCGWVPPANGTGCAPTFVPSSNEVRRPTPPPTNNGDNAALIAALQSLNNSVQTLVHDVAHIKSHLAAAASTASAKRARVDASAAAFTTPPFPGPFPEPADTYPGRER